MHQCEVSVEAGRCPHGTTPTLSALAAITQSLRHASEALSAVSDYKLGA